LAGEDNQGPAEDEKDGNRKEGYGEDNGVETKDGDKERANACAGRHLLDLIAEEVEVDVDGVLDGTDGPPCTLLQMAREVLRYSPELERLVDVSRSPALSDEEIRSGDIFGDTAEGNTADIVEGGAAADEARAGAPGGAKGILNRLGNVNEEVERLAERI
jgi:hypothetical protein